MYHLILLGSESKEWFGKVCVLLPQGRYFIADNSRFGPYSPTLQFNLDMQMSNRRYFALIFEEAS